MQLGTCLPSPFDKVEFSEGPGMATATGSDNHQLPHRDGRERACLFPPYQNSFITYQHLVSIAASMAHYYRKSLL